MSCTGFGRAHVFPWAVCQWGVGLPAPPSSPACLQDSAFPSQSPHKIARDAQMPWGPPQKPQNCPPSRKALPPAALKVPVLSAPQQCQPHGNVPCSACQGDVLSYPDIYYLAFIHVFQWWDGHDCCLHLCNMPSSLSIVWCWANVSLWERGKVLGGKKQAWNGEG